MKRRMIERFLSSFLVLCLLMSLMPTRVGATNYTFVGNATSNKIYNVLTEVNYVPSTNTSYVIAKGAAIDPGYYNQSANLVQVYLGGSPDSSSSYYVSRSGDTTFQVLNTQQSSAFAALFDGCGGTLAYNTAGVQYSCIGGAFVNVGVHLYTSKEFTLTSAVVTYASDIYAVGTQATKSMVSSAIGTFTNGSDTVTATLDISGSEWTVAAYHADGSTDSTFTTPSDLLKLSYSGAGILTNGPNMGYTITFTKSPSSSGTTTTQTKYTGTPINVPTGDGGTWLGHTFKGWTLSSGSATVNYAPGAAFNTDASTTLYAVWEWTTYPVTYDANLGTGAPGSQIKTYGVSLALSSVLPNREGYAFIGWNTDVNGMGTAYNFGATYTGNADLTLYAQWMAETYTVVTYNANGGTGAPGSQTANYAATITLSSTQPTRSGYGFVGWAADAAAESAAHASGGSYAAWGSETLYAVWQSVTDTVSYNANGGSGAPSSQNKTPNVDLTLSAAAPTKTGYAFKGWSTAVNGTVAYNASGIYAAEASIVLYAVWEADTYAVTYNDNIAGELVTVPDAQTKTYGTALTLSNTVPSREGYAFTGWDTSANGAGTDYAPGASHAGNTALSLFAQWTADTYAVNYDANGGTFSGGGSTAGVTKTFGISLILSPTAPTRTGYAFKGWSTAADGALAYGVDATYAVEASISLFAVWEANTFAVTYSDNIADEIVTVPDVQSKSYDTTLVLSNTVPTREGYAFCRWNSSADGEGTDYAPGVNYAVNAALTLYAQWDAKTYDIDYNANGGTYSGSSQDKFHGTSLTLNAALATRSGYNFVGWAADAAAGSASYAAGGSYSTNASVTLYAVWQSVTDVVSYNANGGINPPSSQNKTPNVDLTLSATEPTKTGYAFKGWSIAVNGAVAYGAGDIYTAEASVVLYAVWDGNPYAVTYNDNTAVEIITVPDVQTKIHATTLVLSSTVPIREGYTFSHWNSSANGGGIDYAPGASYAGNATLNLYAQWVTKTFAVSYNANGGTYTGGNQTKTYGAPLTLNAALATRSGYNFVGWAADAAAESASYAAGGSYSTDASITLYAVWQSVTDVVSYNANGGINPPSSQNKTPNVDLTLSATAPTMTGYAFKGWSTAVNGAVAYGVSDIYTAEASVVLYAVWEANTFAVTYSDNIPGEIVTVPDGQTKNYGTTLVLSNTVPTRQGYAFTTWYTTANGAEGTAYEPGASYAANATLNLFAQWSANTYAVSYNANGGTFSGGSAMASAIKTFDVSLTLIGGEGIPARIGYAFTGWSLQASAVTAEYAGGASYTDNGIVTLYAVWVVDKYTTSTSLSVSPSSEVYVGDAITLTATATRTGAPTNYPAAGTTVTFYSGNVVLGTGFVGANGIAACNASAVLGTTIYKAVFNGSGEDKASVNETNTVSLTVKSVTIQLAANTLTVKHGADTITGTLTAGTTYVLTAPAAYATDAVGTALAVTSQYTVEWWWYNGSSWCKVDSDSAAPKQLTITPAAMGQKWYAKILPAGKYTIPASGLSTEQVTCGDMVDTVTTLITSPTAAYEGAENAVTLKASVIYATSSPVTDGWVMFEDENGIQVGYAKLDNQGHADVTITLPEYMSADPTAHYYAVYEGTAYYDSSDSEASMTSVIVKSTTYEIPTVTVKAGSDTIGSTTTSVGLTGLTAGVTYVVSADMASLTGIDEYGVTSGDYTLYWQKESGGATTIVGTGSTFTFVAIKGEAYRLYVDAKNNMNVGATSKAVSVDNLATPVVALDTSYSFLGASASSTSGVVSNRINGSHAGDAMILSTTVTGTNKVPTGTVDFFYIPSGGSAVKLARVGLTEWDTNQAQASFTVGANLLPAGVYTFHAVYNGSTIFSATTSADKAYRVWSVTIAGAVVTATPAASGGNLLTAGTAYAFSMGDIYTTDGEKIVLGTDYSISWYVSTNGSPTGYGAAANVSTGADDNTWTQTPSDSNYRYKAVVVPLSGSESATYPAIGVTSNIFSTSTAATQTTISADTYTMYEGNDITLTATVGPTGNSVPTGVVEFYYYTTNAESKTLLGTANIQSRTSAGGTVYFAQLTTDDLPDNSGAAQDVYAYAKYMGNQACGISDGVTSAVRVKSSVVASTTVLIITANGTFADAGRSISFASGTLPADGSKSILTLGTITTRDGITEPMNEDDFIITWEKSTNFSGIAAEATWITCKTGEYVSEVTPATYSTAYRVKITPKFDEMTIMSGSAYYSNIISAGTAASVTQMSIRSSGTPAAAGSDLAFDVKIFGGSEAPTGSVTFYQNGSSISTCELVNGTASFSRSAMAVGTYVFKAVYTSTNGYAASIDEQTYHVRHAPTISLAAQTATYDGKAHYYDPSTVTVTASGMSDALKTSAAATVSCYYKDASGNVTTPVDAGTYTVYAHLIETAQYSGADATGTLVIGQRTLTITDFIIQAKTYDGTTSVNVMTADTDALEGDSVLVGGTAVLDSAAAGTRTVTYTPAITGGDDAGNYKLADNYTVADYAVMVARNQLSGAITADGLITVYKADGSRMLVGTGAAQYGVTYYHHDGNNVKAATDLTKDGKYTVVVQPNDKADYKGGLSTTMTVTGGVKAYASVTCSIPVSFAIGSTMQIWNGDAKTVTVTPSISGFTGYTVAYADADTSKVGIYGVTITVTGEGYSGSAAGRMQVLLGVQTGKATISIADKVYDGAAISQVITNTPSTNYYVAYAGGSIQGVSYTMPRDAGTYVATLFVESTDSVTAYTASDSFTISRKTINLAADDKTKEHYATNPVWTFSTTGLASGDSSLDFIIQPDMTTLDPNNDYFDQVGTYVIEISGAYSRNYSFTYTSGAFSVYSVDPNVPMTMIGFPEGAMRYGDSIRLYTYGTKGIMASNGTTVGYSDSSVISYTVVSGHALIAGDILTITGTGQIVLKITRGEGQNAIYSTVNFTALTKTVTIAPTFGTNTYDGTTGYNATGAVVAGAVSGGQAIAFGNLTKVTADKINAGSYVMTVSVSNAYYSGTGVGLMVISPKDATVTAASNTTTYGTALAVGATAAGMSASPAGYKKTVASSDVGSYETFAAGLHYNKNYHVAYVTGLQAITAKSFTITAGSRTGTEYGVSTTADITAASFANTGERVYGAGNQVMDYTAATFIAGDSLADINVGVDGIIVSYDKVRTSDANRTSLNHSTAIAGRSADYAITLGTLDAVNYTLTQNNGKQNIYQRDVTVTAKSGAVVTKPYDGTAATTVPTSKYQINNLANNDVIGLTYTAAYGSATFFDQAVDAVTLTLAGLYGDKKLNYHLLTASFTMAGRILPVTTEEPTAIGTVTATLNGTLPYATNTTEVGFYIGETGWTTGQMIKVTKDGVANSFSQLLDSAFTKLALTAGKEYKYYSYAAYYSEASGSKEYAGETVIFSTKSIGGRLMVSVTTGVSDKTVLISIQEGNYVLGTASVTALLNGSISFAEFTGIKDGVFNIVASSGNWTETSSITITNGASIDLAFVVPANTGAGSTNSRVTIDSGGVNAAVDGLDSQFDNGDRDEVAGGSSVSIDLTVGASSFTTVDGHVAGKFDIGISKTTTTSGGQITQVPMTTLAQIIEIAIPLTPRQILERMPIIIYREHDGGAATAMTKLSARQVSPYASEGYYVDYSSGYVFIYSNEFSSFYVAEAPVVVSAPVSGGGGGVPLPTFEITVAPGEGGSITPETISVTSGGSITFTIVPDDGNVVADVLVDDVSVGVVSTYAFDGVNASHTIKAVFASGWVNPFVDVHKSDWFYDAVEFVARRGLMNGTSATLFEPGSPTTRAMIVTMLYRLEGKPSVTTASGFDDVATGTWYSDAVAWAAANVIVKGYDADTFGPTDDMTREQIASVLNRYARYKGYDIAARADLSSYTDFTDVSGYALPGMEWAVAKELIIGMGENTLSPAGVVTRAQTATLFMRFIQNIAR